MRQRQPEAGLMIDATYVTAHRTAPASKGGLTSKLHVVCDGKDDLSASPQRRAMQRLHRCNRLDWKGV